VPVLEHVQQNQRALLIVAEDVEGEALQGLILNRVKANLQVVAIRAPGFGTLRAELMRDLEVLTGATLASSATGRELSKLTVADLGSCAKLVVDAKTTTIVGTGRSAVAVEAHVADLRHQLEDVTLTTDDVVKLKSRIAKLSGGVAVIRVGGATELEMNERKYRIEDALNATRAAADEGIVAGGGVALLHAARSLSTTTDAGVQAVVRACQAPLAKIVENAGLSTSLIVHRLDELRDGMCYDAATDAYVDAFESGIIDPVKVTRCALEHAASVACTFLSMDAVIYDEDERNHSES
jgi:chaperonin GroEL